MIPLISARLPSTLLLSALGAVARSGRRALLVTGEESVAQVRLRAELGAPSLKERLFSVMAAGMAAWTALMLKLDLFQHPRLIRHTFRLCEESRLHGVWRRLHRVA